jgi:hypothetical protein
MLLVVTIFLSSNGLEIMTAHGTVVLVLPPLLVAICQSFDGRERMAVHGIVIHIKELKYVATVMCSSMPLPTGARDDDKEWLTY